MPGIVGIIANIPREEAEPQLLQMVESIRHESFYVTGTWVDESLGVYVGWVVRRGSFADGMPLRNERGDVVLVFSGEEYPEPGTAHRLKARGHTLPIDGPAYLVHLCEEDPSFLVRLNGLFHGVLVDRTQGAALLFNDRYGMHRMCYHESEEAFYFAGEAKAILTVRPELRRPDPKGLGEFISLSCVLENRTIFKGVSALPAASAWVFKNGSLETKRTYFEPREWETQAPLDPENYYGELRDVFSRNLPRYFNGNEQVGVALTGGLDTRAIMAWHKGAAGSLPCYTFGGMLRDSQDVILARRIAKECGQSHRVITVGEEFLAKFSRYAERSVYLTEGSVDLLRCSDLYVSEKAREAAPAKIVGTYGSEIVRHAVMFKPEEPTFGLFCPEVLPYVREAEATYCGLLRDHPVTFAAFRQSPWYHHGVLALEQSQLTVRSPYLDKDLVRTVFRAPKETPPNGDVRLRLIADGNPTLMRIATDRGIGGNRGRVASLISRGYLEFTFKAEYGYDMGMPQWVARIDRVLSPFHLERLFLGRHKHLHFRIWYRDALAGYVREMLLDPRSLSRPYIERRGLEAIVRGHLKGDQNFTTEIHKLLTLELLHRLFLDNPESGALERCRGVPLTVGAHQ
jgi:asparagine synthase (glutamine-hydrolysing)